MKHSLLLFACLCTGCGGVLDYRSRPIDVHGTLVTSEKASNIVVASYTGEHSYAECADLMRKGSATECAAKVAPLSASGEFEVAFGATTRGCPYFLIPPLLDLLCDRKSYLLMGVPFPAIDIYRITIWPNGKSKVVRYEEEKGPASFAIEVLSATQIVEPAQFGETSRDMVRVRITKK